MLSKMMTLMVEFGYGGKCSHVGPLGVWVASTEAVTYLAVWRLVSKVKVAQCVSA